MGSFFKSPKVQQAAPPPPPPPSPAPEPAPTAEAPQVAKAVRAQREKQLSMQNRRRTILTSPQGLSDINSEKTGKVLLGQ